MNIPNTGEAAQQLRAAMESEDENESNRDDEELNHFNAVSKMYIKDETRAGYNSLNKTLLIRLMENYPACVKEDVNENPTDAKWEGASKRITKSCFKCQRKREANHF